MPPFPSYLLQANAALVLFFLGYYSVFRRFTFYTLNRFFLLFGLVFAVIYPLLDFTEWVHLQAPFMNPIQQVVHESIRWQVPVTAEFDRNLPLILFWAGAGLMAGRLMIRLVSLFLMHQKTVSATHDGFRFRAVGEAFNPFSFGRTIYLNPSRYSAGELGPILQHEQIHVTEGHSLDILLAELLTVFFWFNPVSWFFKCAIRENLEFGVDQQMVRRGMDVKVYQYLLLRIGAANVPLGTSFTAFMLKKRIGMMNQKPSSGTYRLVYSLLPVMLAVLILPKLEGQPIHLPEEVAPFSARLPLAMTHPASLDTIAGTAHRIRQIQLNEEVKGKPLREIILITENRAGRGMDLYVKLNGDQIEELKVLALASPEFMRQKRHKK
ncbi:hypothetical protein GCM10027347_08720 [Larkinella harenae]